MSNSNLIQYQKITEPENLNFVFPLSRYNQEINGLKNNFYSVDLSLSYDITKLFPVKNINIRPAIGYQFFLGSIYKEEKWKISGFNFSIGFNYLYKDIDSPLNKDKSNMPLIISDTIIIKDTIYKVVKIDKVKYNDLSNSNSLSDTRIVSKDKSISTKTNSDYVLEIITIKENIEVTNYVLLDDENLVNNDLESQKNDINLIIPNLEIKYLNNGNLTDKYIGKVEKELYDYTVINEDCNDLLNLILTENNTYHTTIVRDTIFIYNYPTFNFNLDIFSEKEIKQSKLILNGFINNDSELIYTDTVIFNRKSEKINYKININNFINIKELNLIMFNSKFKTNTNLKDFTINYNLIIEDTNSNLDSTISGEILLNNLEDKPKKANKETIYKVKNECIGIVGKTEDSVNFEDIIKKLNLKKLDFLPKFLIGKESYYIQK